MKTLFLFLFCSSLMASSKPQVPALRFQLKVDTSTITPEMGRHLERWYRQSLDLLRKFPPQGSYLLNWPTDRRPLHRKVFEVTFPSPQKRAEYESYGARYIHPDFGTVALQFKGDKDLRIYLIGHAEYFFDADSKPRVGAFSLFLLSFAREIFGNVQNFLEKHPSKVESTIEASRAIDVRQSRLSIPFLEKVIASKEFAQLSEEDQVFLKKGLELERKDLARLEQEVRLDMCLPVRGRDF